MDDLVENFVTKCSFKVHPSLVSIWYEMLRKNKNDCVLLFDGYNCQKERKQLSVHFDTNEVTKCLCQETKWRVTIL